MLPPVDTSLLAANPGFEQLYNSLTITVLNSDGSTKNDPAAQQREAVREELREHRLKATRKHLLKNALATVPPPSSRPPPRQHNRTRSQPLRIVSQEMPQLPPELMDLLIVLPAFLERGQDMSFEELELLLSSSPMSEFPSLLPHYARLISSHLTTQARSLARVMHPSTNPSFIHRAIPHILPTTQTLISSLLSNRATLTSNRLMATSNLVDHLDQQTKALLLLLRALEAKHGVMAQSSTLRASDASLEAQSRAASVNLQLWETRSMIYPPESQTALQNYRRHLRDAQMQLSNKLRTREQELGEYGVAISAEEGGLGIVAKSDTARENKFREMARVWLVMEKRLQEIDGDLRRLDKS
ncbi:hypothetical protein E8E14_013338 [Neopestalotiopsis sp. 37M]|nr:hypothetical protein E8E14_013338 [Neopestalotiopsis sp. 37M]